MSIEFPSTGKNKVQIKVNFWKMMMYKITEIVIKYQFVDISIGVYNIIFNVVIFMSNQP